MPDNAIRIEGLRELERAFRLYGRGMEKGLREAMEAGAEVVRPDAEQLALAEIPRISTPGTTIPWQQMRVGVSRRTAYVAPVQRGVRSKTRMGRYSRSKFAGKLLDEAMEPALAQNVPRVEREFGDALDDLGRMWSRV
jgi:hypothetical protein